jgi:hypothetical protein
MTWVLVDDGFDEDPDQLALSDRAFRVWVCLWTLCARLGTDELTPEQVHGLLRKLGKNRKTFEELLQKSSCKVTESSTILVLGLRTNFRGSSTERMRKWRARQVQNAENVTSRDAVTRPSHDVTAAGHVTSQKASPRARDPIPEPVVPPPEKNLLATLVDLSPAPPYGGTVTDLAISTSSANGRGGEYEVFLAALNEATGRRFRGDAASRRLYAKVRHEGRTEEDLLAAARGVAKSAHHMGLNDNGTPYNAPANILRSRVLDQLISLGNGEIGLVRRLNKEEQREAEISDWARQGDDET